MISKGNLSLIVIIRRRVRPDNLYKPNFVAGKPQKIQGGINYGSTTQFNSDER